MYLLNQIWLARSGCQFFFSHLRPTRFAEVTRSSLRVRLHRFARSRLCLIISYLRVPRVPFFHFIPVVYSQGNRLFPFSGTRLVRPVYPKVLLWGIVFVSVLPLLLLLQAYRIGWLKFKEGGLLSVINYTFILRKTFSCRPHLVWRALPQISQYLFISLGGIQASHLSRSDFPKLPVFALFQSRLALALLYANVVLQFSTCRRCRPKLLLYLLERILNSLHSFR